MKRAPQLRNIPELKSGVYVYDADSVYEEDYSYNNIALGSGE